MRPILLRIFILIMGFLPFPLFARDDFIAPAEHAVGMGNILQVILSLLLVLLVFISLVWVMRRIGTVHTGSMNNLKVIEQVSVGQRERLALVQIGEEQIVVGIAPGNVRMLHSMKHLVCVDDVKVRERFSERLADALKCRGK